MYDQLLGTGAWYFYLQISHYRNNKKEKKKKVSKKRRRNLKGRVLLLVQNGVEARVVKNLRQSAHLSFLNLTLGEWIEWMN